MSIDVITEPQTYEARSRGELMPSLKWQIHVPGFRDGVLLGDNCAVLCHTTFPADS